MSISDHVAVRCEPQLALAGEQHVPGLVCLPADQSVLAVGGRAVRLLPAPLGAG